MFRQLRLPQVRAAVQQTAPRPSHVVAAYARRLTERPPCRRPLEVVSPVIINIRYIHLPVSASLLIRMHEALGVSIIDLRFLTGNRPNKYRCPTHTAPRERSEPGLHRRLPAAFSL